MNELLISLAVFLLVAAGIAFLLKNIKRGEEELERMARMKGWRVQEKREGTVRYHFMGDSGGIQWHLMSKRATGHSSSVEASGHAHSTRSASTRWWTESVRITDGAIAIGPNPGGKIPPNIMEGGVEQFVMGKVFQLAFGEEAGALQKIRPFEVGSELFRRKFFVFGTDETKARSFLTASVEESLLSWATQYKGDRLPGILIWSKGVQIHLGTVVTDAHMLEKLVSLGTTLSSAAKP